VLRAEGQDEEGVLGLGRGLEETQRAGKINLYELSDVQEGDRSI